MLNPGYKVGERVVLNSGVRGTIFLLTMSLVPEGNRGCTILRDDGSGWNYLGHPNCWNVRYENIFTPPVSGTLELDID